MKKNLLLFTIPTNLDLESLIKAQDSIVIKAFSQVDGKKKYVSTSFKPKNLLKHLKYCYYFIDLLYKRQKYNPDEYKANSYIHVNAETLERVIPKNTRNLIINLLVYLDVIEENPAYSNSEISFSKSYRLKEQYRGQLLKIMKVDDQQLQSKITNRLGHKTNDLIMHQVEFRKQHNQVLHIEFDVNGALAELTHNYESNGLSNDDFSDILISITAIANRDIYFNINNKVNRVFTTVNQSHSLLRKHIKDSKGKSLIYIDKGSSHLNLLYVFILNCLKKEGTLDKKYNLPLPYVPSFLKEDTSPSFLIDVDTSPSFLKEVEKLGELLRNNRFYEYVTELFKKEGIILSRIKTKELVFKEWLNARYNKFSENYGVMEKEFPLISKFINKLKKDDSNLLINKLMKMESHLINNRIAKRIYDECTEPVQYTVFDAVMIDVDNFDVAYNIMVEEFENYVGLPANLKVEDLNENIGKIQIDGKDTLTNTDYLDRMMKKMFAKGHTGEGINLYMKTFHERNAIKKAIENQSGVDSFFDRHKPVETMAKTIDSDIGILFHEEEIPCDQPQTKIEYTQEHINQVCFKHFGWYKEMEQEQYNELFTKFFNALEDNERNIISGSAFDMSEDEVTVFGRLDRAFRAVLKEYFKEHGIRTRLK